MSKERQDDFFQSLLQISESLLERMDSRQLLERVLDIAMEVSGAERGFILLQSLQEEDRIVPVVNRNLDPDRFSREEQYSMGVLRQVMKDGEPVVTVNAVQDDRFKGRESVVLNELTSILCVPIRKGKQYLGYIYLDSRERRSLFNVETLHFLEVFAAQAAMALETADFVGRLALENRSLRTAREEDSRFGEIIGKSPQLQAILDLTSRVANTDVPVLILGESGTGKELIARAIHHHGSRARKPFIAQYCGALADSLLESELFGYRKGAFTGATADKKGLLEAADGGSFFLDEIADVSLDIQTKLLRFLQEGEFRRVGDTQIRTVDSRIIAATNKDLEGMVAEERFRQDLFYRLNVVTIRLPALRERREDIPLLAEHFLNRYADQYHKPGARFSSRAMEAMLHHPWPGNIRELENAIRRGVTLCDQETIDPEHLALHAAGSVAETQPMTIAEMEKQHVLKVLAEMDGNRTQAAKALGVSLRWLQYRLRDWSGAD